MTKKQLLSTVFSLLMLTSIGCLENYEEVYATETVIESEVETRYRETDELQDLTQEESINTEELVETKEIIKTEENTETKDVTVTEGNTETKENTETESNPEIKETEKDLKIDEENNVQESENMDYTPQTGDVTPLTAITILFGLTGITILRFRRKSGLL